MGDWESCQQSRTLCCSQVTLRKPVAGDEQKHKFAPAFFWCRIVFIFSYHFRRWQAAGDPEQTDITIASTRQRRANKGKMNPSGDSEFSPFFANLFSALTWSLLLELSRCPLPGDTFAIFLAPSVTSRRTQLDFGGKEDAVPRVLLQVRSCCRVGKCLPKLSLCLL